MSVDRKDQAREAVLGRIGKALAGNDEPARRAAVAARLAGQSAHLIPARVAGKSAAALKAVLTEHLEGQSATVIEVARAGQVPGAIAGFLRSANLPQRVRTGNDRYLSDLPWSSEPALTVERGRAGATDEVGLVHATAAAAETGTLLMASGADNPVTLNFLPETSIVVLRADDIVESYEAAFDRLRAVMGRGTMPRTVNLVSGPSRTGDIGGRLVMGAHGPRRLCVVIVAE